MTESPAIRCRGCGAMLPLSSGIGPAGNKSFVCARCGHHNGPAERRRWLACQDLVSGCGRVLEGADAGEVLRHAEEHLRTSHGRALDGPSREIARRALRDRPPEEPPGGRTVIE